MAEKLPLTLLCSPSNLREAKLAAKGHFSFYKLIIQFIRGENPKFIFPDTSTFTNHELKQIADV